MSRLRQVLRREHPARVGIVAATREDLTATVLADRDRLIGPVPGGARD